jgi:sugar/nucleoside kinase (ribokinase family)
LTQVNAVGFSVGGFVPNDGVDLKRLRPELPVYAIGKIGADEDGKYMLDFLQRNGLDVSGVIVSENERTSFSNVMSVVGGQRTFFVYPGANATFGVDDIDFSKVTAKMFHLGYFLLLDKVDAGDGLKILQKAKEAGMKTSIDLVSENSDRYQIVVPCLPYVDNLIINEAEAGAITGIEATKETIPVIAKKLKELGVKERVIIHMPEMAYCYHDGVETTLSSYALPKGFIRGTTGAGDAFCAGALTAIYEELSDREVLERAQMAAVGALREADATSGVKSVEELKELVKDFSRQ